MAKLEISLFDENDSIVDIDSEADIEIGDTALNINTGNIYECKNEQDYMLMNNKLPCIISGKTFYKILK